MAKLMLAVALGIICGSMISFQSAFNTLLGSRIGILGSVAMVIAGNMVALALAIAFHSSGIRLQNIGQCEWYLYSVGFLGVIILGCIILVLRQVGAVAGFSTILIGQMAAALIIDHFGLFSVPQASVSSIRVLGILLLMIGAYFTKL
ncbi:MAG: DMT family transporter [Elusimicrobiota bacterium]